MATADLIASIQTAKANCLARILEVTATQKASYSLDGQGVQWDAHLAQLQEELEGLNKLEVMLAPYSIASQVL